MAAHELFRTERVGALSDGVMAIALTLLVLELKIPEVVESDDVLSHIYVQWPAFVGWIISFLFISLVWHEQHVVFQHVQGGDTGFILVNLIQLACISLIPFGSAILGDFPWDPGALIIFSVIMLLNTLAMAGNAAYVARSGLLHATRAAPALMYRALFHLTAGSMAAALSFLMAYLHDPLIGAVAWIATPFLLAIYHATIHPALAIRTSRAHAGDLPASPLPDGQDGP